MSKTVPLAIAAIAVALYYYYSGCCDGFDPASIGGKRVLVTGASSGIGEQLAYQYCKLGARVMIVARRQKLLEAVADKCRGLGAEQVSFVQADLAQAKNRVVVMQKVRQELGGLDHLLLNHAIANNGFWVGNAENMTAFHKELNINFVSFVDLASQAYDMLSESRGYIGVVSSIAGKIPFPVFASYSADKFALQGFFKAMAMEQEIRGTGISITLCVIGPVETDLGREHLTKKQLERLQNSVLYKLRVTAEDTAIVIMRGVATRQAEIYYGRVSTVLIFMYIHFPSVMDYLALRLANDYKSTL